jgi:hypothetical protein
MVSLWKDSVSSIVRASANDMVFNSFIRNRI